MSEDSPSERPTGKRLREGFTTGACAAAAAKAAARVLVRGELLSQIESTLPIGRPAVFTLRRCERLGNAAVCSVIKDAGDDPDCTHHAELTATVELSDTAGVQIRGGEGVATVTKPGLGLPIGGPAINPVPRKNITEMVMQELAGSAHCGAIVTISVPGGAEMAKRTLNSRLGLAHGISILGTTGIVRPYSTAAFRASVEQAIDVAASCGATTLVLTTGGRTEQAGMKLFAGLSEESFIQMGDFVGAALHRAARRNIQRVVVVAMVGKLAKIAAGMRQTHARQGAVDMEFLAQLAVDVGATPELATAIRAANTARHVWDLACQAGLVDLAPRLCRRARQELQIMGGEQTDVGVCLVDFDGQLLARDPAEGWPCA